MSFVYCDMTNYEHLEKALSGNSKTISDVTQTLWVFESDGFFGDSDLAWRARTRWT